MGGLFFLVGGGGGWLFFSRCALCLVLVFWGVWVVVFYLCGWVGCFFWGLCGWSCAGSFALLLLAAYVGVAGLVRFLVGSYGLYVGFFGWVSFWFFGVRLLLWFGASAVCFMC